MNLSDKDITQIKSLGKSTEQVSHEKLIFEKGIPKLNVLKPATLDDGIMRCNKEEILSFIDCYKNNINNKTIIKFVPASGAASRMFKVLSAYMNDEKLSEKDNKSIDMFFDKIEKFAFYPLIKHQNTETKISNKNEIQKKELLNKQLLNSGLSYLSLPKGLIHFHGYEGEIRTPVIEHLIEGEAYAQTTINGKKKVNIHFTVQEKHKELFKKEIAEYVRKNTSSTDFDIDYSIQSESTNTLAVDVNNNPFRQKDGSILFRPGGHGALLENLNQLDADIIFIKNIDNVTVDSNKEDTYVFKKALAGIILQVQGKLKSYLQTLDKKIDGKLVGEIKSYFKQQFGYDFASDFDGLREDKKKELLIKRLNAPIRVAGMVKNEGEPGGGPFFVKSSDGSVSLQILEQAQLDMDDAEVQKMVSSSTHFNPVDIVCSTKTPLGKKIDLGEYIDKSTYFISEKSLHGKTLKALELPGLWNGSMAHWNTIFVQVPVTTFSPVKEVNDLLKAQHQQD